MLRTLAFDVRDARNVETAASPTVGLRLAIREADGRTVDALVLNVQAQIQPRRRRYELAEAERMEELFGKPERWGETLRTLLWAQIPLAVPGFTGEAEVEMPLPCSYDFEVSANRYLGALENGTIPLRFLFSGTIFAVDDGRLMAARVPWELEAAYDLPVSIYRAALETHFPNTAWIRLGRAAFDDLNRYKTSKVHLTWDAAVETLLDGVRSPS